MAVESFVKAAKLRIQYLGEEVDGKQRYINKTYSNVNPEAEDEDIYDVSSLIADLQTREVNGIIKISDTELMEA